MHDQGKIHGHGMEALVDQGLGEVERGDARPLQPVVVEQGLVHAVAAERRAHGPGQPRLDVVGVEHGVLGDLGQAVGAVAHHVGQRAHIHAHLAVEGREAAETGRAFRRVVGQGESVQAVGHPGHRREGRKRRAQHHRPRARPAAAVRGGKGLVQVDVHGVDAQVRWPHLADDGVEVGPVAIEVGARRMGHARDLDHVALEEAAGIGVGQHHRGHVRAELAAQVGEIDPAARRLRDLLDRITDEGRGGRVGAMGGGGDQHAFAGIAPRLVRRADGEQAAEFAVGACLGRQRHGRHAGQRLQPMRERVHQRERALDGVDCGCKGWMSAKPSQARHAFRSGRGLS